MPKTIEQLEQENRELQDRLSKAERVGDDFKKFRKLTDEEKNAMTDNERKLNEQIEALQTLNEQTAAKNVQFEQSMQAQAKQRIDSYRDRKLREVSKGNEDFFNKLKAEYDVLAIPDLDESGIEMRIDKAFKIANDAGLNPFAKMGAGSGVGNVEAPVPGAELSQEATSLLNRMMPEVLNDKK